MEAAKAGLFGTTASTSASVKCSICDSSSIARRRRRRRRSEKAAPIPSSSNSRSSSSSSSSATLRRRRGPRLAPARACLGNEEGEKEFDLSLAAERLEAALAAAADNEQQSQSQSQSQLQSASASASASQSQSQSQSQSRHRRDGGQDSAVDRLLDGDSAGLQISSSLRWSSASEGSHGVTTTINHRARNIWEEVEESEMLLRGLEAQLDAAIKREDYAEASRLSAAVNALKNKDTVKTVVEQLESALREERYEEATGLRDDGAAGLLGWWVAYKSIDGQRLPHGHIIKVEPRFARCAAGPPSRPMA